MKRSARKAHLGWLVAAGLVAVLSGSGSGALHGDDGGGAQKATSVQGANGAVVAYECAGSCPKTGAQCCRFFENPIIREEQSSENTTAS